MKSTRCELFIVMNKNRGESYGFVYHESTSVHYMHSGIFVYDGRIFPDRWKNGSYL